MKTNQVVMARIASVGLILSLPFGVLAADEISPADLAQLMKKLTDVKEQIASLREELKQTAAATGQPAPPMTAQQKSGGITFGDSVKVSGEAGVAFFDTGRNGLFPNNEFRVDEAKLFLDAKIRDNVFFFTELNLATREDPNGNTQIGELYIEVEDVQNLWDGRAPVSIRAGRMDIPFGEEYLSRDAVDNPFVSHTLADIWGIDEGVEIFGKAGMFDYTAAVQNGSYLHEGDGNQDKAITGRIGMEPASGLRFSASAMRTGDLSTKKDQVAELWFGNSYLSPIGSADTTTRFYFDLGQLDARYSWDGGYAAGSFGGIHYDDNDSIANNSRSAGYWSAECEQALVGKLYGGVRYSQVHATDGFWVPGQLGDFDKTSYQEIENMWRISAALGYRWSEHLVLKAEYSWERGKRYDGSSINEQDMISSEISCGF
jgi:hypothetical protein